MRRKLPEPPRAARRPHVITLHGDTRVDEFHWLRDPAYPELRDPGIRAYLEAENRYAEAVLAPVQELREQLFHEIRARIKEEDSTVPYELDGFWYYVRWQAGAQYAVHCRRRGSLDAPEEILLDENRLAEGRPYLNVGMVAVSPDHRLLAWSIDTDGSERYEIRVRPLDGSSRERVLASQTDGTLAWAEDRETLLYVRLDDHQRPRNVYRRRWSGDEPEQLVYAEPDPRFFVSVRKTRTRDWILLHSADQATSEVRILPAHRPDALPLVVSPRRADHEYHVTHHRRGDESWFYILTNDVHRNFRLVRAPAEDPRRWEEVLAPSDRCYRTSIEPFRDHLVLFERENGLPQVTVLDPGLTQSRRVSFPDAAYCVAMENNPRFDAGHVRLSYESMVTPRSVLECDLRTLALRTLKVQEIPTGYDSSRYETQRLEAVSHDGVRVPISLVRRRDAPRPGPLYLYGYGAYGLGIDPRFSVARLSLLDRGFAFAIAHVRGGDELGYHWYEDGKRLRKKNTFLDFIACAEHLVREGYTRPQTLAISGGSAGGMLIGAVLNERPELFGAAIAHVPFVDCLNTMLDESLPLTACEYSEWGDPRDPQYYFYIKSYAPYENVRSQAYPPLLVTAGLHDPRVTYWEPAKWVARLRARKTDDHLLVLRTNMGAGHAGPSGRFEAIREAALEYAFLLLALDMAADR